jgi:putative ABC transport system permease protein
MIFNYLKLTFRNLAANKVFSFINIFGLAAGLSTCMLIMIYMIEESSYDKQFADGDRIYRISMAAAALTKDNEKWSSQPAPTAWALKAEYPAVEQVTRLLKFPNMDNVLLKYEQNKISRRFFESNGYYVDSTFFQLFNYDFKYGRISTALNRPNSLVISESIADKLFGHEDPVGKPVTIGLPFGDFTYMVTGVFVNAGLQSHIPANFFMSMRNSDLGTFVSADHSWTTNSIFHTYVKLKPGSDPAVFEKSLTPFFYRHAGAELKAAGISKTLFIQPLQDIYLHSQIGNEIATNGNIKYLYILGSIAGFILFIACINFMNLSTARSQKRAREVGVRKVLGANRGALVRQFLGESFIICTISFVIAVVLVYLLLPGLNHFTGKQMVMNGSWGWIFRLVALILLTGFLAGLYPAFYLSSFKPVSVLKGKILHQISAVLIRKGLVVFQFTISICLIFAAIVIWRQLELIQNQDLGFSKSQLIILPMPGKQVAMNYTALKTELLQHPDVKSVTSGSSYPGITNINDMLFYADGKPRTDFVDISVISTEKDYLNTLGLKLLEGRSFEKANEDADTASIVLNETALNELGYKSQTAVGKKINYDFQGVHHTLEIVGVVKDFNFESLYNPIKPLAFSPTNFFANKYNYAIVSIRTNNWASVLSDLEKSWNTINASTPFTYTFLDEDFARNYEKEQKISGMVIYFMVIAVLVACLGLFGLAAFSAEYKIKEIGVRKVLGASVGSVAALLSKEFITLVIIAIVIALPLSTYVMQKWLENFAYRIHFSWWMFFVSGLFAVLIALITISFHTIKAGLANPVNSLRSE